MMSMGRRQRLLGTSIRPSEAQKGDQIKPMPNPVNKKSSRIRPPRTRRPNDPKATIQRILDGTGLVLCRYGHTGVTTRRVAAAAEISLGNLTYHFSNKSDLMQAFIQHLLENYERQVDVALSAAAPMGQELESLVRVLMADTVTEEVVRLFREIWAMSLQDPMICRAIDDFYDALMEKVVQHLSRSQPNADITKLREVAQLIALLTEGACVLYGTRRERVVPYERIIDVITQLFGNIGPAVVNSAGSVPMTNRSARGAPTRRA
jgi:AcrR family transcriptional regulator